MKKRLSFLGRFLDLFEEDSHNEALYDPIHVGGVVLGSLTAIGALYWLLWTLLVFEGGFFMKISAAAQVLFTQKTAADFGYEGSPYAMGAFEGWFGNLAALLLSGVVVAALHRLFHEAKKKSRASH